MDIHQNDSAYIDDTSLLLFSENCSKRFRNNGKVSPKLLRRQLLSNLKKLINYNSNLTKNCNGKNLPTMSEGLMDNIWLVKREGLNAASLLNNVYKLPSCDKTPCIFFTLLLSS